MKGEDVILLDRVKVGQDPFGADIYDEVEICVPDVIVGTPSTEAITTEINLYGKSIMFVLGIPKGDKNDWKDKVVLIRGERYRTYGFPLTQTEANVPGRWNTQVKVERYE